MTFLLCSCKSSYKCCDQLNNATVNTDCTCSDQMGGIGTCICTNLPNTRSSWLCKKDSNGDSVNIIFNKVLFFLILIFTFNKSVNVALMAREEILDVELNYLKVIALLMVQIRRATIVELIAMIW